MAATIAIRSHRCACILLAGFLASAAIAAHAEEGAAAVAQKGCAALAGRVDTDKSGRPILLRSYDAAGGKGPSDEAALRTAAFTYDNALAVVALLACDRRAQALRIGEALRLAAAGEARLRNAYRDGAVEDKPQPNGWWDAAENRWIEDGYQAGTATGNVAWTALALLALNAATGDARWRDAAEKLAQWVVANTSDRRGSGGFDGGVYGFDPKAEKLSWKATEHNVDLIAVFVWLDKLAPAAKWHEQMLRARRFVDAQWDKANGRFVVGTLPDGVTRNRTTSALDVQLWPLLLPDAARDWRRAVAYAVRAHGVPGGFDFNADRDGLWLEGTAQAALTYRRIGRGKDANALFANIVRQFASGGYVYATREPRISTGLALSGASESADFYYYRQPHLGATAWPVLAARDWDPLLPGGKWGRKESGGRDWSNSISPMRGGARRSKWIPAFAGMTSRQRVWCDESCFRGMLRRAFVPLTAHRSQRGAPAILPLPERLHRSGRGLGRGAFLISRIGHRRLWRKMDACATRPRLLTSGTSRLLTRHPVPHPPRRLRATRAAPGTVRGTRAAACRHCVRCGPGVRAGAGAGGRRADGR
jgi:hypothetical protein